MIATCVAGGARKIFFERGVVSGASECGASVPGSPVGGKIIFPLQYSPNYYVIEEPAAQGERASFVGIRMITALRKRTKSLHSPAVTYIRLGHAIMLFVMCSMLSYSTPCHAGPCHHALVR